MDWYEKLYLGKNAEKKSRRLVRQIESGKAPCGVWLLTLAPGPENQLELVPARELGFWYARKRCPLVVGLACGKEEALELLIRITEDVEKETGGAGLRAYFAERAPCRL